MSRNGKYFGYAWTNYSHPAFIARLLQKIGFTEVMQLDIHPAIGAALVNPSNDTSGAPFFKGGAYGFVPLESEAYDTLSYIFALAGEQVRTKPMQWPYTWANTGSSSDFFGVFIK